MSEYYVNSSKVEVFPSTRRSAQYASSARLLSEKSFSRLINQIVDRDAFIISYNKDENSIEFNIHGYYFKVTDFSTAIQSISTGSKVYACIEIDDTSNELYGQDEGSLYKGVYFTSAVPTEATSGHTLYYLSLGTATSSGLSEDIDSYIVFNIDKLDLKNIDCGIID